MNTPVSSQDRSIWGDSQLLGSGLCYSPITVCLLMFCGHHVCNDSNIIITDNDYYVMVDSLCNIETDVMIVISWKQQSEEAILYIYETISLDDLEQVTMLHDPTNKWYKIMFWYTPSHWSTIRLGSTLFSTEYRIWTPGKFKIRSSMIYGLHYNCFLISW